MTKPATNRMAALRQRRTDEGLKRLDLWAHPDDHAAIKATTAKISAKRARGNGEKLRSGGMIAFAWFVFERGCTHRPEIDWI